MMTTGTTFRVTAVISALLGALLILGTWDGLYSRLDVPQALPALGPQIGGVAVLVLGYLLWAAASNLALRGPLGVAGSLFYLGSAGVIAVWLIFKGNIDLGIGDRGRVELIVAAILFALLGGALARASRSQ